MQVALCFRKLPFFVELLFSLVLIQITERAEWFAEMEELGEGKKYRNEIHTQIAQRLRKIKQIETKLEMQKQGYRFAD